MIKEDTYKEPEGNNATTEKDEARGRRMQENIGGDDGEWDEQTAGNLVVGSIHKFECEIIEAAELSASPSVEY